MTKGRDDSEEQAWQSMKATAMITMSNRLPKLSSMDQGPAQRKLSTIDCSPAPESLEQRQVRSVTNPRFSGSKPAVPADDQATNVERRSSVSNLIVRDHSSNRRWIYTAAQVSQFEFQGGNSNDQFVNDFYSSRVRAFSEGGNDFLQGYNGNNMIVGGSENDTDVGHGCNEQMWSDDQNDVLIAIDGNTEELFQSDAGDSFLWIDRKGPSNDGMARHTGFEMAHEAAGFVNGGDRSLNGDRTADPNGRIGSRGAFVKAFTYRPLYSTAGPRLDDIRQGPYEDFSFVAEISAIARDRPNTLLLNILDFDDGVYRVRMGDRFCRVDDLLPIDHSNSSNTSLLS